MKTIKILIPSLISIGCIVACNNNDASKNTSPTVSDTTSNNPTSDAADYHPDERQHIPTTDSSNTIGTDTIKDSTHK